jgi:hypothetical protein
VSKKFGALAEFRQTRVEPSEETRSVVPSAPPPASVAESESPKAEPRKGKSRPAGKRSNPDFEPTTLLLRKATKRKASRLLEDTGSEFDLSDLAEALLGEWIAKHSNV